MASLYMLAIVHRRDLASIRDLKKSDVPWLKGLSAKITSAICAAYPGVEGDQLKLYVHCKYLQSAATPPSTMAG